MKWKISSHLWDPWHSQKQKPQFLRPYQMVHCSKDKVAFHFKRLMFWCNFSRGFAKLCIMTASQPWENGALSVLPAATEEGDTSLPGRACWGESPPFCNQGGAWAWLQEKFASWLTPLLNAAKLKESKYRKNRSSTKQAPDNAELTASRPPVSQMIQCLPGTILRGETPLALCLSVYLCQHCPA